MIILKNNDQLKSILRQYKAPDPDENRIETTIRFGHEYMNDAFPLRTPIYMLVKTQVRFISPYLWLTQLFVIILFVLFSMNVIHPLDEIPKIIFLLSPLFSLVAVPEIMKSEMFGMAELEQTSKHSFLKILLTRAMIINSINILLLTIILIFISVQYQVPFLHLILYGLVPMNIVNGLNLLLIDVFNIRSKIILTGIYMGLIVMNYAIVESKLFLALSYSTWLIIFIISSIVILTEIYVLILKWRNRGGVQWS